MSIAAIGISDMPTEILEKILDSLHDDRAALYSASLVCRSWVFAPRYHLFHRTIIKEMDVLLQGPEMMQVNIDSFLSLSQSRYCTILPAMRCVVLCVDSLALLGSVIKILARAKALSQVVFFEIYRSSPPPCWMAQVLPDIHDFTYNVWSTFGDIHWHFLASFPHLRTLALHTLFNKPITFPRDIFGSWFSDVTNIQLKLFQSEELFDWMNNLAMSPLTRVETLDLAIFRSSHKGWGSVRALNSFLKKYSETLKNLSVTIDYERFVPANLSTENIDLSPLINLRSLFLQTHDMDSVCCSISSLSSCYIESLTVRMSLWEPENRHDPTENKCDCDFYELFVRLANIMEQKQFITETAIRHLTIPKLPKILGRYSIGGDVSIRWPQKGVLDTLSDAGYDKQRNTWSSLRHILWENPGLREYRLGRS